VKAGAFVLCNQKMVFVMGPTGDRSALAIVRLGGHREDHETVWDCARREVFEESRMRITPLQPALTFCASDSGFGPVPQLEPIDFIPTSPNDPIPLITGPAERVTPMFLAESSDQPRPSMEIQALVLLTRTEVYSLCSRTVTLKEFQAAGGKAVLRQSMDGSLPLQPLDQLIMLSTILERYLYLIPPSLFP
jgi:hypothetical protein